MKIQKQTFTIEQTSEKEWRHWKIYDQRFLNLMGASFLLKIPESHFERCFSDYRWSVYVLCSFWSTRPESGHPIFGYYWAFSEEDTRPPFQILKMSIVDSKPKKELKLTGSLNFCFSEIRGFSLIFSQSFDNLYLLL